MGTASQPHRGFEFTSRETSSSKITGLTIINGYGPDELWGAATHSAGGAIFCKGSSPTIEKCIFKDNDCNYWGGTIYCYNGNPLIRGCTFIANEAFDVGGAIYNNSSNMTVSNCVFGKNIAAYGGAIYNINSSPVLNNCTFSLNSASSSGGAIRNKDGITSLSNCILWEDTAASETEIFNSNGTVTVQWSDIQWNWPGEGNIDTDPMFVDPSEDDYHLMSEAGAWSFKDFCWHRSNHHSPCIDTGNPASDWTAELWPHGKRINMGAYGGTREASMSISFAGNIADLDNSGQVDYEDLMLLSQKWLWEEILLCEDLNRDAFLSICLTMHYLLKTGWNKFIEANAPLSKKENSSGKKGHSAFPCSLSVRHHKGILLFGGKVLKTAEQVIFNHRVPAHMLGKMIAVFTSSSTSASFFASVELSHRDLFANVISIWSRTFLPSKSSPSWELSRPWPYNPRL